MTNIYTYPQADKDLMATALGKIDTVKSVRYEYPGFWEIETAFGTFSLGDTSNIFSWHTSGATEHKQPWLEGASVHATIYGVVLDFAKWLETTFEREILANAINARFACGAFVTNTGGNCMAVEIPTKQPFSFILHGVEAGLEIWDYETDTALVQIDLTLMNYQTAKEMEEHYLELIDEMMRVYPHLFTEVN